MARPRHSKHYTERQRNSASRPLAAFRWRVSQRSAVPKRRLPHSRGFPRSGAPTDRSRRVKVLPFPRHNWFSASGPGAPTEASDGIRSRRLKGGVSAPRREDALALRASVAGVSRVGVATFECPVRVPSDADRQAAVTRRGAACGPVRLSLRRALRCAESVCRMRAMTYSNVCERGAPSRGQTSSSAMKRAVVPSMGLTVRDEIAQYRSPRRHRSVSRWSGSRQSNGPSDSRSASSFGNSAPTSIASRRAAPMAFSVSGRAARAGHVRAQHVCN
jgi:hypothetical protein